LLKRKHLRKLSRKRRRLKLPLRSRLRKAAEEKKKAEEQKAA